MFQTSTRSRTLTSTFLPCPHRKPPLPLTTRQRHLLSQQLAAPVSRWLTLSTPRLVPHTAGAQLVQAPSTAPVWPLGHTLRLVRTSRVLPRLRLPAAPQWLSPTCSQVTSLLTTAAHPTSASPSAPALSWPP